MRELVIETAQRADLTAMLDLLRESALPCAGVERDLAVAFVAREQGAVIACAALERYGSLALLRSVAVAARWRGQGLGRCLTEAELAEAQRLGVTEVYLLTETAAAFFERLAFRSVVRSSVPPALQASVEWREACPQTATVMVKTLV